MKNAPPGRMSEKAARQTQQPLEIKLGRLEQLIAELGSAAVAFSGGVDSAVVLKVASDKLKDRVVGITAVSESLPSGELKLARAFARTIEARHVIVRTDELSNADYAANTTARCFHCKDEVYRKIKDWAAQHGFPWVIDGFNLDDLADHRPGHDAGVQLGVKSPLIDAGLGKKEIREIARQLGLRVADKPALACLSSRIPYGTRVTVGALKQIDHAESYLRELGLPQVRVRHFGSKARIEILPGEFHRLFGTKKAIVQRFHELGYAEVTLDLAGYRMGSLNPVFLGGARPNDR